MSDRLLEIGMPGPLCISVRVAWLPDPGGRHALRWSDHAVWESARWCHRCRALGYDHAAIDAVLEAQRLGVDHAPEVSDCPSCGAPRCATCPCCTG